MSTKASKKVVKDVTEQFLQENPQLRNLTKLSAQHVAFWIKDWTYDTFRVKIKNKVFRESILILFTQWHRQLLTNILANAIAFLFCLGLGFCLSMLAFKFFVHDVSLTTSLLSTLKALYSLLAACAPYLILLSGAALLLISLGNFLNFSSFLRSFKKFNLIRKDIQRSEK